MKKILLIVCLFFVHFLFAQSGAEVAIPLSGNFQLSQYAKLHPDKIEKKLFNNTIFSKTGYADSSFPFVERFTNSGNLIPANNWQDASVSKVGQTGVFNALDKNGNVYPGNTYGQADTLTSQNISLTTLNNLYIEFMYSIGSTWYDGDSLKLAVLDKHGKWRLLWQTSTSDINKTVFLTFDTTTIPLDSLNPAHIVFRFINSTILYIDNSEDFILHNFVFAHKIDVPFYDNMSSFSKDSFPSKQYWSQAKTTITNGAQFGLTWCNPAVFNALDENKNVYNNSVGSGYADTLMSHYIDLTKFELSDSVFLKFYYRAMPNNKVSDSLILQFRNNAGNWIHLKSFAGNPFNDFRIFSQYINLPIYRGSLFQFRLINKCSYTANDSLKWIVSGFGIDSKLSLPIIEDFSTSAIYPNKHIWKDKLVYINNNFPIAPPSFNVATFDGLDSRGNPYCTNCPLLSHSYCDSLTSMPINLAGYTVADSIYLSFFIEPGGFGKIPNSGDSFIVEMRNKPYDPNSFISVWGNVASQYSYDKFTQVLILVDSSFLHDDFQFRFKNIGSLNGNTDQWHLDYIRLESGRNKKDTNYFDNAISMVPTSLISPYSSMPWKHYFTSPLAFDIDTQYFKIKNNYKDPNSPLYYRTIYNDQHTLIDSFGTKLNNFAAGRFTDPFLPRTHILSSSNPTTDTVLVNCKYSIKEGTAIDNIPTNDTLNSQQIFSNYFAYDDGSAEAGYAVTNYAGSVALGYALSVPDVLYGIAIFFNQSAYNVSDHPFEFRVWERVGLPPAQTQETVLKDIVGNPCVYPFPGPVYQNQINGFYYYKFHDPIIVTDTFFIGWHQSTKFELNVGLDQNFQLNGVYGTNPMMYFKTMDVPQWQQTQLTGALMIRPIVGKWIDPPPPPVGVQQIKHPDLDVSIYPNPARNEITIQTNKTEILSIELMDMAGRLILSEKIEDKLVLPALQTGMYLLKIINSDQQSTVKKIIIQQ